jgi:single-stranded DNA-binding protein
MSGGSRVVVGRLRQRSWTAEDGSARPVVEVVAEELGAKPTRQPDPVGPTSLAPPLAPGVSRHATASTGPLFHEDGQTARPGNRWTARGPRQT